MEIPEKGPLLAPATGKRSAEGKQQSPLADLDGRPLSKTSRDTVRLTDRGRELNSAVDQARSLPDVRLDRVMQLKQQLAQGTYRVEGNRIAVNMIDESIENNTVLKHIDTKV